MRFIGPRLPLNNKSDPQPATSTCRQSHQLQRQIQQDLLPVKNNLVLLLSRDSPIINTSAHDVYRHITKSEQPNIRVGKNITEQYRHHWQALAFLLIGNFIFIIAPLANRWGIPYFGVSRRRQATKSRSQSQ